MDVTSEPLAELGTAYGVPAQLDTVADAIIHRTQITAGINERTPVIEVVALLIEEPGGVESLRSGNALSPSLVARMQKSAESHNPAMPAPALVELALRDIRSALSAPTSD